MAVPVQPMCCFGGCEEEGEETMRVEKGIHPPSPSCSI